MWPRTLEQVIWGKFSSFFWDYLWHLKNAPMFGISGFCQWWNSKQKSRQNTFNLSIGFIPQKKKKSHNHSLKLLDHMNWNGRLFPSPYGKKSEFTSNWIYINQTKPFNENSASLTVKRVQGLSYLTVFTAGRKQSRIPSKSLDLRTGKASLHVSNYNHFEVIRTFITFA